MGSNESSFPCRVGRVVLNYFEDRPKLDVSVVLSSPGLDFGFLEPRSSFKIEFENHRFLVMFLLDFVV